MPGFIHDKLEIKVLALYLLSRVEEPVDFAVLTDLALCDPGVDYFRFAEAAAELCQSGHVRVEEDGRYSVTEKGLRNCVDSESTLSPVIRRRCDRRLAELNARLRRRRQVRAAVEPGGRGEFFLRLTLDDDGGNLMTLSLLTATAEEGERMAERFRSHPEQVYHKVLAALLEEGPTPPAP